MKIEFISDGRVCVDRMYDTYDEDCIFLNNTFQVLSQRAVLISSIANQVGIQHLSCSKSSFSYLVWQLPFIVRSLLREDVCP